MFANTSTFIMFSTSTLPASVRSNVYITKQARAGVKTNYNSQLY